METRLTDDEKAIIEAAGDLVAMWKNPNIQGLPRQERNAAIEYSRARLIEAVDKLTMAEKSQISGL